VPTDQPISGQHSASGRSVVYVRALLIERVQDDTSAVNEIWMAVNVHDVVEIARPAALCECAQLLAHEFGDRVREHAFTRVVVHRCTDGRPAGTRDDRRALRRSSGRSSPSAPSASG
jgi:hypothetical protein